MARIKNNNSLEKKHLLYDLFNPKGNGKGLTKAEASKPRNLSSFFTFYSRNFNLMFALNIFAFLGNFPILFGLYALTGNLNTITTAPTSSLFSPLYGALTASGSFTPASASLFGVHGIQTTVSLPTAATSVFGWLTLLVIFTFGIVNLSTVYIMRNLVKGDPVTFISDIRYSIKKNWKQGLILGIIDLLFIAVIAYDLYFFYVTGVTAFGGFLFGVMIIVALIYTMMRFYMYIMLVTFDLSIYKIFKNSFIFALLGFKRNIMAVLGTVAVFVFDYMLMMVFYPLGLILPVMFLVSLSTFMGIYAAYPKVKQIMIDPYYVSDDVGAKRHDEVTEEDKPEEPIFKDRG